MERSMFLTSSEVGRVPGQPGLQHESPSQIKVGVGCSERDKFGQNDCISDMSALRVQWVEQYGSRSPTV